MDIRISKENEVPVRRQLAEQIVYLIATEKLQPGEALPSVRALARRLGIHHNTVSEAYQDLVRRTWLVGRRGSHLIVRGAGERVGPAPNRDLDDLINNVIRLARAQGHTLQALRDRVRRRLLAQPPDHILVVEEEAGMRRLLQEEIRQAMRWPVRVCSRKDLAAQPGLAIGALVTAAHHAIADVDPLAPKDRPAIPLAYCGADEHLREIRRLHDPSVIAVVSVSEVFAETSRGLLASAIGRRHTFREFLLPLESAAGLEAADLIFCDSVASKDFKRPRCVHYRLIAPESLAYLSNAMESYQSRDGV